MRPTIKQLAKLLPLWIGVVLVVGMIIFSNLNRAAIYNELVTLDLIPKAERLTELYFDNSADLPSSAADNQMISFTFIIHNLETTDYSYVYDVFVIANGTKYNVDNGSVLVKNDQYYFKDEKIKFLHASGSQEIVVELVNKQQSIDFWMGN